VKVLAPEILVVGVEEGGPVSHGNDIYVVDLGGDIRNNTRLSGTKHNVFGIRTGFAILVKQSNRKG
jgi:hypothetical protein